EGWAWGVTVHAHRRGRVCGGCGAVGWRVLLWSESPRGSVQGRTWRSPTRAFAYRRRHCVPNYAGNKSPTLMELFPDARYFLALRPKRIFDRFQRIVFGSFARFPYCLEKGAHKFYEMLVGQFVQL